MAITYSLEMAAPLPAAQVAGELHDVGHTLGLFDAMITSELILDEGVATRVGTWIRMVVAKIQPHDPVTEDFGFIPTVRVAFRLDKFTDTPTQQDDMIRLVSNLLDRVPGDAVLHFQYEQVWLLRQNGEMILSEDDDIWPPQRLAAVHQPYSRATHGFS